MSIEQSTLNSSELLTDDTRASQKPAVQDPTSPSAQDLQRGYSPCTTQRIPTYDSQIAGGENEVGDPFAFGGFLGRPQGFQR